MISVRSISCSLNPLDQFVEKQVCDRFEVKPRSKFHLVENGTHYLVTAKAREVFFDDDMPPSDKPDVHIDVQKLSFDEASARFPSTPATYSAFVNSLSDLPLIDLKLKLTVFFSHEIRHGMAGIRGSDHEISMELLSACIQKKKRALYRGNDTEFYLFDDDSKRVIKMVVRYPTDESLEEQKRVTILTAFYPTRSYLRYQLGNCSDARFQSWIDSLPKVSIL
ncbi:MAG: hypothetical protein P0S96_02540 [Simkaniaceae bacterium]|nr:hypothetical protein [Candidatus Sacchlamyda saccharinae]